MMKISICPVVAAWTARGWYDLDELRAHMLGCEQCKPIVDGMVEALRAADAPDIELVMAWIDEDGGCEATDGCWVEADGRCPHGKPSWAIVMGLV